MPKSKRLLALVLVCLLALSLCACGDKEEEAERPDAGSSAPTPAPTPTPDPTPAPDPEPGVQPQPDSPVLPTPEVSGGAAPAPAEEIRPEIRAQLAAIQTGAEDCVGYFVLYFGYDASAQKAEEQTLDGRVAELLGLLDQLAQMSALEMSAAETQYYRDAAEAIYGLTEPWQPLLDAWLLPEESALPEQMLQVITDLETMYGDTFQYMVEEAGRIFPRITNYSTYLAHHDELMAFYNSILQRCLGQDPAAMRAGAENFYRQAAVLPAETRDRAMEIFFERVHQARVDCVDRFFFEYLSTTYFDSCYLYFITDEWQGDTPADQWAAAKIAAQNEFYGYSQGLLDAQDVSEFHFDVAEGFARGDFDVAGLMAGKD